MREIKFRGRRVDNGEWVKGSLIDGDGIVGPVIDWNEDYFNTEFWWAVNPETVGQYTGLKDKNGVEIYDGDVVESDAGLSGIIKFLPEHCAFLVYFKNENENCYEYLNCELTIKYMKVIGNIHEVTP